MEKKFNDVLFSPEEPSSGSQTKMSRRNWLILIVVLIISLCLCSAFCALAFGKLFFETAREKPKIELVIEQFMSAMANQDVTRARALFSTRAKKELGQADFEKMIDGNNYVLFSGYQSLTITGLHFRSDINTNPIAKVQGTLSYEGGFTGRFDAHLEQEGEEWKLFKIQVTVEPDKFSTKSSKSQNNFPIWASH